MKKVVGVVNEGTRGVSCEGVERIDSKTFEFEGTQYSVVDELSCEGMARAVEKAFIKPGEGEVLFLQANEPFGVLCVTGKCTMTKAFLEDSTVTANEAFNEGVLRGMLAIMDIWEEQENDSYVAFVCGEF